MKTLGRHLLVEYHGCNPAALNDKPRLEALLTDAAQAAGATVVQAVFHTFCPQGVSGVVVIEESHLSIHTWPETGYAAIDFYTCGDCEPTRCHERLCESLRPERWEVMEVSRGLPSSQGGMRVNAHRHKTGAAPQRQRCSTPCRPSPSQAVVSR